MSEATNLAILELVAALDEIPDNPHDLKYGLDAATVERIEISVSRAIELLSPETANEIGVATDTDGFDKKLAAEQAGHDILAEKLGRSI